MDNDSVIDPLQSPNESRCKNVVPRSTSNPFLLPYQQRASFDFSPLPPGSIEQSPLPLFFFFCSRRRRSTKCEISRLPFVATHLWSVQSVGPI